jgi:hypothetical protein
MTHPILSESTFSGLSLWGRNAHCLFNPEIEWDPAGGVLKIREQKHREVKVTK